MILPANIHPTSRTLIAYLDAELPIEERLEIRDHIGMCDLCRSELDYMEADLDWFLVLEAAARPIETRPQPGSLGRLLAATREWRDAHPDMAAAGGVETERAVQRQSSNALELLVGPTLAAALQRQDTAANAEALLGAFLGRRAATALMVDIRRTGRRLASDVS